MGADGHSAKTGRLKVPKWTVHLDGQIVLKTYSI